MKKYQVVAVFEDEETLLVRRAFTRKGAVRLANEILATEEADLLYRDDPYYFAIRNIDVNDPAYLKCQ